MRRLPQLSPSKAPLCPTFGDGNDPRHATGCGSDFRLAGRGTCAGQNALYPDIPSEMFVTCFYAILELESATLSYANAGHDLPYLWHGGDKAEELRARGTPLGLMPEMS
jgi:hypothetical protein